MVQQHKWKYQNQAVLCNFYLSNNKILVTEKLFMGEVSEYNKDLGQTVI